MSTKDITGKPRNALMIDLYGMSIDEVRADYPGIYQWVLERVKPERDVTDRQSRRERWWIFGEALAPFRPAMRGLKRMIGTPITSKHRLFLFLGEGVAVDSTAVMIASDDAFVLGTISSSIHATWALRAGSKLGVGNDPRYNKTRCFEMFPFPACTEPQKQRIRELAEQLDAHRKRQQELHPNLTLTDMYNVLEKLRAGAELSVKEKKIHDEGLVSVLKQIHDDLDAAVFAAYGWPATLTDEQILERLVALNAERAAEEARGLIRWLRPEFQRAKVTGKTQGSLDLTEPAAPEPTSDAQPKIPKRRPKEPWPKEQADRTKAVQRALANFGGPVTAAALAKLFHRARASQLEEILDALTALGLARRLRGGKFTA